MKTTVIAIDANLIKDWPTFHSVFQSALGFPGFYGRNMDAWVDCMDYIDQPESRMTSIVIGEGDLLALRIDKCEEFKRRCPEQFSALIECTAFVNFRRTSQGRRSMIALLLSGDL
nr:barstar family protein [Ensifer aridi]